jgi:phosphate transport system permease protein
MDVIERRRFARRRSFIDRLTTTTVRLGGLGVMTSIALIFFYLIWIIAPMFYPAAITPLATYQLDLEQPQLLDVSESIEIGFALTPYGIAHFWGLESGTELARQPLGRSISAAAPVHGTTATYALVDANGNFNVYTARYPVAFSEGEREVGTHFTPLFSSDWLELGVTGHLQAHWFLDRLTLAEHTGSELIVRLFTEAEADLPLLTPRTFSLELPGNFEYLLFGPRGRQLYLLETTGRLLTVELDRRGVPTLLLEQNLLAADRAVTAANVLVGGYSLLLADSSGQITQWFATSTNGQLEPIRQFELDAPVVQLIPEPRRKGFAAIDELSHMHLLHTTSARVLADHKLAHGKFAVTAMSPRADLLLRATEPGTIHSYRLDNEHPEISLGSLFAATWYEGYEEPIFSWQSSSADNDFEPKFSLTPLLFGTLKAAFYAMLFAVPLAVMGALYSAYSMSPAMRSVVKPSIEIMAALPTVILGFMAGIWLAPLIESNLAGVLAVSVTLPLSIVALSWFFQQLPGAYRSRLQGWYGLICIPVVIMAISIALSLDQILEQHLFGGSSKAWLAETLGLDYDQRNALVVGLAMGFAVVPTVFAIAEDAINGVPRHLITGSLALGATRWQTLLRVVLLTASPGIFSAIMIGMGRAVGETMIVLMATGNTPIMDMNLFEGMRTFAANIAIELPESEVGGTHYRILFLTALVLFLLTFVFNTAAELVRLRLRDRYGEL